MSRPRIIIALDPAAPAQGGLDAIARLAGELSAAVLGVLVEDDEVHRLAALGLACEVPTGGAAGHGARTFSASSLEAQLLLVANEMQAELAHGLRHMPEAPGFERMRGAVVPTLQARAQGAALLVVTRNPRAAGLQTWFGARLGSLAESADTPLLVVNEPWASGSTLLVFGADDATQAAAEQLAHADRLPVRNVDLPQPADAAALVALCHREDARVIALSRRLARSHKVAIAELVEHLPVSVLLVP